MVETAPDGYTVNIPWLRHHRWQDEV